MKKIGMSLLLAFCAVLPAWADGDHSLTSIEGKDIALKLYDHALAGSMKDFVLWGVMEAKDAFAELGMRKHGQTIRTRFVIGSDKKVSGMVEHLTKDGARVQTRLVLQRYDAASRTLHFAINEDKAYQVTIKPERIDGRHLVNPEFVIVPPVGDPVVFKVVKGEACVRHSSKIAPLILAAYLHP